MSHLGRLLRFVFTVPDANTDPLLQYRVWITHLLPHPPTLALCEAPIDYTCFRFLVFGTHSWPDTPCEFMIEEGKTHAQALCDLLGTLGSPDNSH